MHVTPVGPSAAMVEVGSTARALALATWARPKVAREVEVVPGASTVLFDGVGPDEVTALLAAWPGGVDDLPGALVTLRITYDGPDLDQVARHWRCSVPEVVARHQEITFRSVFSGFAPGFSYLEGLGDRQGVPRLPSPRPRVPAGAVGLGDTWCGVYPTTTPGGWLLIGTVSETLWDPDRREPALLAPGTRVRFLAR